MSTEIADEIANYKSVDELMHTKVVPAKFSLNSDPEFKVKNNIIYVTIREYNYNNSVRDYAPTGVVRGIWRRRKDYAPTGVVICLDRLPEGIRERVTKQAKRLVICAADRKGNQLNDVSEKRKAHFLCPSMSFECVARLLDKKSKSSDKSIRRVFEAVAFGSIAIVDFIPDEHKALSKAEKTMYRSEKKRESMKPPAPGYTLVGSQWHRPATVLLMDTNTKIHYMMGQDDGQYFGVQLAGTPKSIANAFADLMPKEALNNAGVLRQGEWFAIPVTEKDVPQGFGEIPSMVLPKDSPKSNDHVLEAGEIRIGNGFAYARSFCMEHDQHRTMRGKSGWYKFMKNTAIKSVSVEGVD